jgi:hypothetical protein
MDNLDFGIEVALIVLAIGFLASLLKTLLVFAGAYHFSKMVAPMAARKLQISQDLSLTSKQYAISFLTAWLFIVPLTLEFVNLLPFIGRTALNNNFNDISFYDFYLIGLTLFTFDKDLTNVELKKTAKSIRTILIYFFINIIIQIMFNAFIRSWYGGELHILQYLVIKPIVFGIVTVRLVKRNNINAPQSAGFAKN